MQVLDALANVEDRSASHRRLLPGDGGVLLEHEPALVPRRLQLLEDFVDSGVATAQRAEQPSLRGLDERELGVAHLRGEPRVHILEVSVHDPLADPAEAAHEYGIELKSDGLGEGYEMVVVAVPHAAYQALSDAELSRLVAKGGLLADLKNLHGGRTLAPEIERWTL